MMKAGIDQDALITMFAEASAKQGEALRKAVSEATLRALQGRELTLDNIRKVVKNVAEAASTGIARNPAPGIDVEALLGKALGGIDSALLQAVEANRKALEQFVSGGVSLSEKPLKEALANIEKMEDVFFATVTKASQSAGPLQGPWQGALDAMKTKGSATGAQATQTVEQLMGQAQTMLRDGRASGLRAAQAMLDSYAALASGVLIGMSEGLQAGTKKTGASGGGSSASAPAAPASSTATAKKRAAPRGGRRR
ncbi:MAG TPA: DUF6781 family protein [Caldimonas sp.]|jgi:ElaB/YqjD/DUF883 family membrane-anchored ribosome-binding protein|nr:DUF6781 family protein [Caldimonas sp.]